MSFDNDVFAWGARLEKSIDLTLRQFCTSRTAETYDTKTVADIEDRHLVFTHESDVFPH